MLQYHSRKCICLVPKCLESPKNWENKTSAEKPKHKGFIANSGFRAQVSSQHNGILARPQALNYSCLYTGSLFYALNSVVAETAVVVQSPSLGSCRWCWLILPWHHQGDWYAPGDLGGASSVTHAYRTWGEGLHRPSVPCWGACHGPGSGPSIPLSFDHIEESASSIWSQHDSSGSVDGWAYL